MNEQWIRVTVHPHARRDVLISVGGGRFEAWVRAKPVAGEANQAVTELLVRALRMPRHRVRLVKGRRSRHKIFQIL